MSKPETWLEKRYGQALLKGVKPNFITKKLAGFDGQIGMKIGEKLVGGAWTSGALFLTSTDVSFEPSFFEKALVQGDSIPALSVPLTQISRAEFRKGLISRILDIESPEMTMSLRGIGMDSFLSALLTQKEKLSS